MTKLSRIAIISLAAFTAVSAAEAAPKPEVSTDRLSARPCGRSSEASSTTECSTSFNMR